MLVLGKFGGVASINRIDGAGVVSTRPFALYKHYNLFPAFPLVLLYFKNGVILKFSVM
jgi:hypothetical protein